MIREVVPAPSLELPAWVEGFVQVLENAARLCSCGGTGMRQVHCDKCDDSGDDHHDCPDDEPCDRSECVALRAAIVDVRARLGKA